MELQATLKVLVPLVVHSLEPFFGGDTLGSFRLQGTTEILSVVGRVFRTSLRSAAKVQPTWFLQTLSACRSPLLLAEDER